MSTFCQNSFQFHDEAPLLKDLPNEPSFSLESAKAEFAELGKGPRSQSRTKGQDSKPPAKRQVKGEEPCDEMRRKGLGEEPQVALSAPDRFSGQKLGDLYVLEVFAGTARLTRSLKQKGFKALAFDRTTNRSEGQAILETDLSNRDEVASLLEFIRLKTNQIVLIHMAPPCGTASRARGKRLKFLRSQNIKEPMPLRSDDFPDGFH